LSNLLLNNFVFDSQIKRKAVAVNATTINIMDEKIVYKIVCMFYSQGKEVMKIDGF
jgi:hypothetical protein